MIRQTAKLKSPPNFPAIRYFISLKMKQFKEVCDHHEGYV